jgi:cell division protein FtsN
MQHLGKLTTLGATGAVALCLLLVPAGAGAAPATVATSTARATGATSTTPPKATTPAAATTATTSTKRWTVLVGTFPTKAAARTQLAQLRKLGFEHFHVVHVGNDYLVRERHLHHATATKLVAKLKTAGITATELQ